jgi:UDP-N-acetylglucosamine diphosphorylase/glucosamine-1-phosphate N-acetyltransferase
MSTGFVLYDDATARAAEPFALTRPFGEMRVGAAIVRERWEQVLGAKAAGFVGAPHLATFEEFGSPPAVTGVLKAGTLLVNARCAPSLRARVGAPAAGSAIRCAGATAAVALARDVNVAELEGGRIPLDELASLRVAARGDSDLAVTGWWVEASWGLVRLLPEILAADAAALAAAIPDEPPAHVDVLGAHRFAVARGAYVEPQVVVDTTAGDVVVMEGARIGAFARLAGPIVIGAHTQVAGGRYSCVAAGEHSRICGEMTVVSVQGHANKGHDGFIGHSVIGRWANLGAGTLTSNLKNSYGPVRVSDSRGEHETGMQFLGSLIGDHVKLAIGTRLNTGTIIGAGSNLFGGTAPPKYVEPFSWGEDEMYEVYDLEKFLAVVATVMQRRSITLTPALRATLTAAWKASD